MTDQAFKVLVCETTPQGTTIRVLLRHTPGAEPPALSRGAMTNPSGFVVTPPHPRYRLPDADGLGRTVVFERAAFIAASASAGDTILPITMGEDPVEGLSLQVSGARKPGLFKPDEVVIISKHRKPELVSEGELLATVQTELDHLAAWLDGQTWEVSLEESQSCAVCLVHRWHQVGTMTGVHDKSLRSTDRTLVDYARKLADTTERRLSNRPHDWVDSKAWDYASRVPQPAALLEHAGGILRIRVDPMAYCRSRPRFRGPGMWLRGTPEAIWTDATARAAHFEMLLAEACRKKPTRCLGFRMTETSTSSNPLHVDLIARSDTVTACEATLTWTPDAGDPLLVGLIGVEAEKGQDVPEANEAYERARAALASYRDRMLAWRRNKVWRATLERLETCAICRNASWMFQGRGQVVEDTHYPGDTGGVIKELQKKIKKAGGDDRTTTDPNSWTTTFDKPKLKAATPIDGPREAALYPAALRS